MKRLAMFLVLIALATTGCGATADQAQDDDSSESHADEVKQAEKRNARPVTVTLNDGTTVECVVFYSYSEGPSGGWCTSSELQ